MLLALAAASFIYNRTFSTSVSPRVNSAPVAEQSAVSSHSDEVIQQAFTQKKRALQVNGKGMVSRILADDNQGSRHQRFILKLASGQTLLIAHNIDLAARIDGLQLGDEVSFYGQYEYNDRGGVVWCIGRIMTLMDGMWLVGLSTAARHTNSGLLKRDNGEHARHYTSPLYWS